MSARILVIEDNHPNLDLMTYLLTAFGHTPLTAHDGAEGLEAAQREAPDLIVCDVHLPRVDGYEVARQLKTHPSLRRTPLVAVTALAMVGDRDRVLAAGFDGYIPKPIVPQTFVTQVEAFLRPEQRSSSLKPRSTTPTPGLPSAHFGRRHAARRITILVVDDLPANRELIESSLSPFGYDVVPTHSAEGGLVLARESPPDLILCDVHLGETDGFSFFHAVKADPMLRAIPFLFISSSICAEKDRIAALAMGADRFILRPIAPQELLAEIEACLPAREATETDYGDNLDH
jgi:CheY-like chemotaxis protein